MEILVCVKQVPDADVEVKLNASGAPDIEKIHHAVGRFVYRGCSTILFCD